MINDPISKNINSETMNLTSRNVHKAKEDPSFAPAVKDDDYLPSFSTPASRNSSAASPFYHRFVIIIRKIVVQICLGKYGGGMMGVFQDVMVGTILAMLAISLTMWLDFVGVVHFKSARRAREQAFRMIEDPVTLISLEESTGLKFMRLNEFNLLDDEISSYHRKFLEKQTMLEEQIKELEENKINLGLLQEEVKELEKKLGFDKWCGNCSWKGRMNCDERSGYVQKKYNKTPKMARNGLLQTDPQCKST